MIRPGLRQFVSVRNSTADSTYTGTQSSAQQNRAADDGGDGSATNSADGAAGEGALLLVGHVVTAGERGEQQSGGGKAGER